MLRTSRAEGQREVRLKSELVAAYGGVPYSLLRSVDTRSTALTGRRVSSCFAGRGKICLMVSD